MRKKKFYSVLSGILALIMVVTAAPLDVSAQENTNHVRNATMSASSVEENSANLVAAKANDGDESTQWSSDSLTSAESAAAQWLQATFSDVTQIQHIKVKFHTRNIDPSPANVSSFRIEYTDENGDTQVAKEMCEVAASGDGYATEISIVLDEPIMATAIKLCNFTVKIGSTQWNSVGIAELEAYSEELEAGAVTSVDELAAQLEAMTGVVVETEATTFELPEAPEGYTIELNGADFEQIIADDLTVVHPLTDKEVKVSYKVSDSNGDSVITNDITYVVEGTQTQEEGMNAKPVIIPEIQEWYSDSAEKLAVASLTKVTYSDNALEAIVDEFIADYEDFTGVKLIKTKGEAEANAFNFTKEAPDALLGEEGYTMDIFADRINVKSESVTGNMYGMQTILQMYKQDAEEFSIGSMRDYPRFEVRGLLLDIARKPIAMNMINDIAKTMRYYKMNDFQLHLSDNLIFLESYGHGANENEAFKAYEAFRLESGLTNDAGESPTAKDYFITKDDMRAFIQGQRALGMNIVPEIDMPAHATSFTKIWPELMVVNQVSPLNSSRPLVDHFDVSKQEAIDKIKEIFDDYTTGENPTFDEETIVHVGADEFVASSTAYRQFVNQIVPHVKATNTVRMWGGLTWLDDNQTEIISDAIENVEMNLWSSDWADGLQMYNMGYKLINTIDDYGYMVPSGSLTRANAYGDLLNVNRIFNSFEANRVKTRSGYTYLPSGDDQVLGAVFAIWSDNIDKYASGLTESDLYWRFFDALPFYAEKTWAATGQEKGSADALAALAQEQGTGPNTNPYYQEDKIGESYASYDFEDGLEDRSENDRDLAAGTATVENGTLTLDGGNSYVTSPIDKLGNGNELSFDITLTEIPAPGDIIFETTPEYGTHDIRIMEDGKLGFTRELYNYYFDYELPVGKTVNIKIVAEQQDTTLYVNGELIGEATGKFIHNDMEKKTGITHSTFAIPLERIGSESNAIAAEIDNVLVKEAEEAVDLYNKAAWTGTTDSETVYNASEGLLRYAFDGNSGTIWHSNWQGATDKLTGSNSFYAEIDFGQAYTINQFSFTPRTPQASGRVTVADLYVKESAEDEWTLVAENATFANDDTKKTFVFEEQDVRYVKFVAKQSNDGWVAVSEFDIANKPQQLCNVYVEAEKGGKVSGATEVVAGTEVTVTAEADAGYLFAGWYNNLGEKVSEEAEYTFNVQKNTALVAKFESDGSVVPEENKVIRISGTTRYETGYKVADALKEELGVEKFDAVVVATGKNFADALAGSYLAVQKNAPIILTNGKDDNVAALHAYIAENVAAGGKVYILGGDAAVPESVEAIDGYDVVRLSGKSRYETNLASLAEAGIEGTELIVATGKTF
ncbi:MAG: discoidin domain-containing protein, partial [Lachnospiraceae bacterium]|nr:discoidin domain-containing protein [Lachnospiraceae bacterium]